MSKTINRIGVMGTSCMENEFRIPTHPEHLEAIPKDCRSRICFEHNYGSRFSLDSKQILRAGFTMADRHEVLSESDVVIIPKPTSQDLAQMKSGAIACGWMHAVQQTAITQAAIDRKLTLVAWESMYYRQTDTRPIHIFFRNNELAGYSAVLHAFQLAGISALYGPKRRAAVLGFGATARGTIEGLRAVGITDITVISRRPESWLDNSIPGVQYKLLKVDGKSLNIQDWPLATMHPSSSYLKNFDVVANCVLQDTNRPLMFVDERFAEQVKQSTMIIDVSCDRGMGFPFAEPTSFESPTRIFGNVLYYSVDHTPSFLWNTASWEISRAFLPFLIHLASGKSETDAALDLERVLCDSTEVSNGVIRNNKILDFQGRSSNYPHAQAQVR
jgi:alanine dehydrogenase